MDSLIAVLQSLSAGLPVLILHLAVAVALWLLSLAIYLRLIPHDHPIQLIRDGNVAAAIAVGSLAMSFAVPLAFCLAGSISVWDIVIWSVPILLLQFIISFVSNRMIGDVLGHIVRGDVAVALFLFMLRMSAAALVSAAIAG